MATHFPPERDDRATTVPIWTRLAPFRTFLSEFLRKPLRVGSPIASSQYMVERLLMPVDWSRIGLLVEYGPGTGRFTAGALARMRPDAMLIAIDTSPDFTGYLKEAIPDPRLCAVTASAADAAAVIADQGFGQADCILSGLPFSTLPRAAGEAIVAQSCALLTTNGLFLTYQARGRARTLLERRLAKVGEAYEWRNLPPCHLYWFRKKAVNSR